jgi:hypothetical protein
MNRSSNNGAGDYANASNSAHQSNAMSTYDAVDGCSTGT